MKELLMNAARCFVAVLLVLWPLPIMAQRSALRGQVTDESSAVVPAATVELNGPSGVKTTKTGGDGNYAFTDLPPGDYTLRASAPQLELREPVAITLRSTPQTVNLVLHVLAEKQEVTVEENSKPTLSTEASANASAV